MKYIRVVLCKGNQVHHLNTDMEILLFNNNMSEGKPFTASYSGDYYNRIDPSDVICWKIQDTSEGCRPTFQY
jgi:hypothetical protein